MKFDRPLCLKLFLTRPGKGVDISSDRSTGTKTDRMCTQQSAHQSAKRIDDDSTRNSELSYNHSNRPERHSKSDSKRKRSVQVCSTIGFEQ